MDNKGYSKCYVSFIDIVGFKDAVEKSSFKSINHAFEKIEVELRCLPSGLAMKYNQKSNDVNIKHMIMSDSIVIFVEENESYALEKIIWATMTIQVALLAKRPISLSRGAISYGDFYFDGEQTMFGQALVNAVILENQKTPPYLRNPRVIIDPKTIKIDREYEFLKRDENDGNWFVDYIPVFKRNFSFYIYEVKEYLNNQIVNQRDDIKQKYVWLNNYLAESECGGTLNDSIEN